MLWASKVENFWGWKSSKFFIFFKKEENKKIQNFFKPRSFQLLDLFILHDGVGIIDTLLCCNLFLVLINQA